MLQPSLRLPPVFASCLASFLCRLCRLVQVYVLMGRMARMLWRNPVMFMSETAQYVFMGLFIGLIYLQ
jgi:hypothetical protein